VCVEPDEGVYDRIDPYWIDFELILVPHVRRWKWRMSADHGVEFFIHPAMQASPEMGFPEFFPAQPGRSTTGHSSGCEEVAFMIKSDAQRERTVAQIEGFRQALGKVEQEKPGKRSAAIRGSYEGMIRQLEDDLREYDRLVAGELTLPNVERLDRIAPFIPRIRIAKGISQTELARRLGVSKQVISRYEENGYQTVAMARLQEILDAIGIKALVTLSA
jgi:ribosome-binding protein aMBF1 (putative translation factor)